jgi:hypothetical protein
MKALINITIILVLILHLSACGVKRHEAFEHDAVVHDALKDAVTSYFTARMDGDVEKMYGYINPSAKKSISKEGFITQQERWAGTIIMKGFSIGKITFFDPSNARVEVIFHMGKGDFPTEFPFIYEDGGWYRRYPTYETDIK